MEQMEVVNERLGRCLNALNEDTVSKTMCRVLCPVDTREYDTSVFDRNDAKDLIDDKGRGSHL